MSDDTKTLNEIKEIGKRMENSISEYFDRENLDDPTKNFNWEYILIDKKKVRNAWCMPGGKIAVYTGILDATKNTNGLQLLWVMRLLMLSQNILLKELVEECC